MAEPTMQTDGGVTADKNSLFLGVSGVIAFLAAAAFLVGPRITPGLIVLLAAIPIAWVIASSGKWPEWKLTPLLYVLLAFGIYLMINAMWSVVPIKAYGRVAQYFAYVMLVSLGLSALESNDKAFVERLARYILWATLAASLFVAIEVVYHSPIKRFLLSTFTFLQPSSSKHIQITNGWVTRIGDNTMNRNVASVCLMLWPVLLIATSLLEWRRAWIVSLALMAIALTATALSRHETSMLALGFSALIFVIVRAWPKTGVRLMMAGWMVATMLVVPIAMAAFSQQLHFANSIPSTGRARIILWGYTAEQVMKNPLLGVGVSSTKPLDMARADTAERPKGYVYALRTGRHSHNVYMQTWYELGAIGAVFMCIAGLMLIGQLGRLPGASRPFAMATFSAVAVTAAFSWGMWQSWFMAAFAITALVAGMAIELAKRRHACKAL